MIYEKNKEYILKNHPYLLENISDKVDYDRFEIEYGKQGFISNIIDKKYNITVHNDLTTDLNLLINYDFKNSHLLILTAFDSGIYLKILLSKYKFKHFVVIEKDAEYFNYLIHFVDLTFTFRNKNILFIINKSENDISILIERHYGILMYENIRFIESKNRLTLHKDYYDKVKSNLKILLSVSVSNYHTVKKFIPEWEKNILSNLNKYIKYNDINCLKNIFHKLPCLLIAAGPSLEKNIVYLKEAEQRFIIIAVDTAVRSLLDNDIYPDIVVSIDSQNINYKYLEGLNFKNTFLVAPPMVQPDVFEIFAENIFVFNYGHSLLNYIDSLFDGDEKISVIGSVSSCALDICVRLGCSPVVLLGCDFGFKGLSTHTKTAMNDILNSVQLNKFMTYETFLTERNQFVNTVDGYTGKVNTNNDLLKWKVWFEDFIKDTGVSALNCSEDGVILKDIKFDFFKNIYRQFEVLNINFFEILKNKSISNQKATEDEVKNIYQLLFKYYEDRKKKIEIIDKSLKKYQNKEDYYFQRCNDLIQEMIFGKEINGVSVMDVKKILFENDYNITETVIECLKNLFSEKIGILSEYM